MDKLVFFVAAAAALGIISTNFLQKKDTAVQLKTKQESSSLETKFERMNSKLDQLILRKESEYILQYPPEGYNASQLEEQYWLEFDRQNMLSRD